MPSHGSGSEARRTGQLRSPHGLVGVSVFTPKSLA